MARGLMIVGTVAVLTVMAFVLFDNDELVRVIGPAPAQNPPQETGAALE